MPEPLSVLLVEDSENDARLLVRELERSGYAASWERVETAGSMRSALERRSWDLIIADYTMPKFSAPSALALLQDMDLDIPFIIVSGSVGEDVAVEAMRAGAHDYLSKGNLKRLFPAIQRELGQAGQRRARRKADEQYRELVANAPIGIFQVAPDGAFVSANATLVNRLGYDSAEELLRIEQSRDVFFEPSEWASILEKLEGPAQTIEARLKRKDGTPIWFELNSRAVRAPSGVTMRYEVFAIDISARKAAERESLESLPEGLRDRKRRMVRDFVVGALVAVLVVLVERPLLKMEEKWVDELVVALTFLAVAAFVFSLRRLKEIQTQVSERERVEQALRFLRGDLESRVEVRTAELRKANDGLRAEIEERTRTEEALRKSEDALRSSAERYRLLFEKNPEPMWVFDEETLAFLAVNEGACRHYGYSREDFLGMTIRDIRSPEQVGVLLAHVAGETEDHEEAGVFQHRKKSGALVDVEITSDRLIFDGRRAQLIVAIDVTERRHLEEQLRQAQKMEAIGALAGGIAHDFNNVLTAIIGYGTLLASRLVSDASGREEIDEILRASERAAGLTRQLLAFSRRQVLEPVVLSVNGLIADFEKLLKRLIREDVELVTRLDSSVGNVRADPGQLEQVVMNLVVNGRDAMPGGGRLTIETANVDLDEAYAQRHASVRPGRYIMVAVSDTGTGMDAETQARIFEPFFTTKEKGEGTGLGLSTVYGIVKQSGGNIWVYSEPGKGTTFKVYFPRVDEIAAEGVPHSADSLPGVGTETILLVEDELSIRALAKRVLEERGYRVLEAGSGKDALERIRGEEGQIHLLLTDLVMPDMGGTELASRLEDKHPTIRVLFMSGYTDDGVVRNGLLGPGRAFLQKPFTPTILARKVREILS